MANSRKKVKDGVWIGGALGTLILYALLADWWKTHAVLGWIILIVLLGIVGYVLYKYAEVCGWLGHQVKETISGVVFEKTASEREPLPKALRAEVLRRAQFDVKMNNSHNNKDNLIALCPNCHQRAHNGELSESQLINWVRRDFNKSKISRAKSDGYCMRCGASIALDKTKPYCFDCYNVWKKYKDPQYKEKFCHICGSPTRSVSMDKPMCTTCFRESKR